MIEECPSSFVDEKLRNAMAEQALRLAKEVKYDSAGTVEFVVDDKKNFYFLEMNTRLQVEHPVTELVTGVDLVEQMINCADGKKLRLSQQDINLNGWSIESRIYAEDPLKEFLPSIGRLIEHQEPKISNKDEIIRNDTGVSSGSDISIYYDPMISKLAVHAVSRDKALDLMIRALEQYYIEGVDHNVAFLISTLKNRDFRSGNISTNFIKSNYPKGYTFNYGLNSNILIKFINIASLIFLKCNQENKTKVLSVINGSDIYKIEVIECLPNKQNTNLIIKNKNKEYSLKSNWTINEKVMQLSINDQIEFAKIDKIHNFNKYSITVEDCSLDLIVSSPDTAKLFDFMPEPKFEDLSKMLISPMPGLIKNISVEQGQKIKKGEQIVIIEAMKMENILKSEKDCLIIEILVKEGDSVSADEILINFE